MEIERFVETGRSSFFGDYLYDQIVPADHFLRKLKQIIPWERFTQRLIKLYKGGGLFGRPPFSLCDYNGETTTANNLVCRAEETAPPILEYR